MAGHTTEGARHGLLEDLRSVPLGGTGKEANLQTPFNARRVQASYYVRNLSATRERRYMVTPVSNRRVPPKEKLQEYRDYSPDQIKEMVNAGENLNVYEFGIKPVHKYLHFDTSGSGGSFLIPYKTVSQDTVDADSGEECDAPRIAIPEGLFYAYYGNWELLTGDDHKAKIDEITSVGNRWGHADANIVIRYNDDGAEEENAFGYIEFSRKEIRVTPATLDMKRVMPGEIVEV